jgi:hypothetical protein
MTRPEPRAEPLRGLTGAGASKVGVEKAIRARDVSREEGPGRPGEPGSGEPRSGEPGSGGQPAGGEPTATDVPTPAGGPQSEGGSGSAGSSPDDS